MKRFLPCSGKMFLNGIAVIKLTKFGLKWNKYSLGVGYTNRTMTCNSIWSFYNIYVPLKGNRVVRKQNDIVFDSIFMSRRDFINKI